MTHINIRRDTSTNWTSANLVLQNGETGIERDTQKFKFGDGTTPWNDLPYAVAVATKASIGLANVDNTSDLDKPVSTAVDAAIASKANLASPAFTGSPTAPNQPLHNNSNRIATTAYVQTELNSYAPLNSPLFTGVPQTPMRGTSDNSNAVISSAWVKAVLAVLQTDSASSLKIGDILIQWGTVSVTMGGAASQSGSVTFGTAFSATPYAVLCSIGTAVANKLIASQNTGGTNDASTMSWGVKTGDGSTSSASPTLTWLAIGPA